MTSARVHPTLAGTLSPLDLGVVTDDTGTRQLVPASGVVTILDDTGQPVVSGGVAMVDPVSGRVSYVWAPSEGSALLASVPRLSCRASWVLTLADLSTVERVQWFDVVVADLRSTVTDADLARLRPDLDGRRRQDLGFATGGTTTTLIDTDRLTVVEGDFHTGSLLTMRSGANAGERRRVIASDPVTGTLTLDAAFGYAVAAGDAYAILLSWLPLRRQAWMTIHQRIVQTLGAGDAARLLDGADLSSAHLHLSLALICETLAAGDPRSNLKVAARDYRQQADADITRATLKVDAGDGTTVPAEAQIVRYWGP